MRHRIVGMGCVALLVGCTTPLPSLPQASSSQLSVLSHSPLEPSLSLDGQSFTIAGLQKKLQQKAGAKSSPWQSPSQGYSFQRHPELLIQDVLMASESGEVSIFGSQATAGIQPDYAGKMVSLTLQGTFERRNDKPIALKNFLFTLEPPLVQQTLIGKEPNSRVLLDDAIPLQVVAVSRNEIRVNLNTEGLPDLYLKGLHKLTVEHNNYYTDALVQVGDPAAYASLQPRIDGVEVMREKGQAMHVRLRGANFMVYPKLSYATIDGQFGFGFQTEVSSDGTAETIVHVPVPKTFDSKPTHTMIYATPFGVAFKEF